VLVFRHAAREGAGYLGKFLTGRSVPWRPVNVDAGDPVPASPAGASGLVFMGGPMSVHDDLPWIAAELNLIRQAVSQGTPVLGHCLGGQLLARALGGSVTQAKEPEIGWGRVRVLDAPFARDWFGDIAAFQAFHWHGETFTPPVGATRLLASDLCENQGFALGQHFGLQCHVEMTAEMVREWCEAQAGEIQAAAGRPGVQRVEDILGDAPSRLAGLHAAADRMYQRWLLGLAD